MNIHLETNYSLGTGLNNTLSNAKNFRGLIEIAQASFLKTEIKAVSICNAEAICFVLLAMQTENALCNHRCSRWTEVRQKGNILLLFFLPDNCFAVWEYCENSTCIRFHNDRCSHHRTGGEEIILRNNFAKNVPFVKTINKYSRPDRFVQTDISILVSYLSLSFHFKSDNETFIWYGVCHIVCLPAAVNVHNLTFRRQRELFWKQG